LLDQKVAKSQGFPKMAENRRAFWLEETKVVTFSRCLKPMYKNHPCISNHHRKRFFFILCCLFSLRHFWKAGPVEIITLI